MARILEAARADAELRAGLVVVLSADHGGDGLGHGDATDADNYRVPFIVAGDGIPAGDIYDLAPGLSDPGDTRPPCSGNQPVRNCDVAKCGRQGPRVKTPSRNSLPGGAIPADSIPGPRLDSPATSAKRGPDSRWYGDGHAPTLWSNPHWGRHAAISCEETRRRRRLPSNAEAADTRRTGVARRTVHPVSNLLVTDKKSRPISATIAIILAVITLGYFAPWAIAAARGKSNAWAVFFLNFFLGWTVIGWVVSLVMACTSHQIAGFYPGVMHQGYSPHQQFPPVYAPQPFPQQSYVPSTGQLPAASAGWSPAPVLEPVRVVELRKFPAGVASKESTSTQVAPPFEAPPSK